MLYNKYVVEEKETFNQVNYPKVITELARIKQEIAHIPIYFKEDIIVSFLKDHSLQLDWIGANRQLTDLVTSGTLAFPHTESLFESCRRNKPFTKALVSYIKKALV
jgi:hypothetical protein